MKRLTCVVEGHGELAAVPVLCSRILNSQGTSNWSVDEDPIRLPRSKLVDALLRGNANELERALTMALSRKPNAILVLYDADDTCPVEWASEASKHIQHPVAKKVPVAFVMPKREFESWLLHSLSPLDLKKLKITDPELGPRDAKGMLQKLNPVYKPSTHQVKEVRTMDIPRVRKQSRSFRKLFSALEQLTS